MEMKAGREVTPTPTGRIPKVARLMALAIRAPFTRP